MILSKAQRARARRATGAPGAPTNEPDGPGEITRLLTAWSRGETESEERLIRLVYADLRHLASRYLARERRDHTLQPTCLVHESYLRLVDQRRTSWQNRNHFFAIAARIMRRILIDHARAHAAEKRGGRSPTISLHEARGVSSPGHSIELIALDESLSRLERLDPLKGSIVQLRFFAGMTIREAASVVGCSRATAIRHWRVAKAWLYRDIGGRDR